MTFIPSLFFILPHLSLSLPSTSKPQRKRVNKHDNLSFIYPFLCDSSSLKWQSFGYDLHLEWFSISHHCHPPDQTVPESSGTFSPPHVLSLFNLLLRGPQEISLILTFLSTIFISFAQVFLSLAYLCLEHVVLMVLFSLFSPFLHPYLAGTRFGIGSNNVGYK